MCSISARYSWLGLGEGGGGGKSRRGGKGECKEGAKHMTVAGGSVSGQGVGESLWAQLQRCGERCTRTQIEPEKGQGEKGWVVMQMDPS